MIFLVQYGILAFAKFKRPDCTRLHLRVLKFSKFSGGACPRTPLVYRNFVAPNGRSRAHIANILNYATPGLTNKKRLGTPLARIIICETPAKSSSEVLKQLNWMTLDQRRAWNKVNLVRKCTLSQTPNYLSNSFARQNSNHSYSTRNNDFLILPKVRTNYRKRTFLFSGAGLFNSLPPKIRNVDNKDFARLSREFFKIRMNFY